MHQRTVRQVQPMASLTQTMRPDQEIFDEAYDAIWPQQRMPGSARRYRSDVGREGTAMQSDDASRMLEDEDERFSTGIIRATNRESNQNHRGIPVRRTAPAAADALSSIPERATGRHRIVNPGKIDRKEKKTDTIDVPHYTYPQTHNSRKPARPEKTPRSALFYLGLGLCIMLAGWLCLSIVANWWQVTQDDWHYGRPRTYQVDQIVGHNDSQKTPSHFIALNLNRHIEVIEFPAGDAANAKIYMGPLLMGQGQDLAVVTLTFKDLTGDNKLDMIINVQDNHFVFINDNGQFRAPHAGENIQV